MAAQSGLPPVPIGSPTDSYVWQDYQIKLQQYLVTSTVLWANVDKSGSNLSDIATRLHNSLQGIQGGAVGDYNHLTTAQITAFTTLIATTGSLGGGALAAGACATTTVAVTGATTSMTVSVSPNTYPGDGNVWFGYVSAAGTVTVKVCAVVAGTPGASTYNVRVLK